jgi:hypothetical protein
MSSSDARMVNFAQARVNRIAGAIDGLAEQIRLTNSHVERLDDIEHRPDEPRP